MRQVSRMGGALALGVCLAAVLAPSAAHAVNYPVCTSQTISTASSTTYCTLPAGASLSYVVRGGDAGNGGMGGHGGAGGDYTGTPSYTGGAGGSGANGAQGGVGAQLGGSYVNSSGSDLTVTIVIGAAGTDGTAGTNGANGTNSSTAPTAGQAAPSANQAGGPTDGTDGVASSIQFGVSSPLAAGGGPPPSPGRTTST